MFVASVFFTCFIASWPVAIEATDLLAVYHQSDYDAKMERCEVPRYNHSMFKFFKADFVPYNRTHRALNYSSYIIKDLSYEVNIDLQLYKFMSNEYRFFPLSVSVNFCKEFDRNSFNMQSIIRKASNTTACPWKKGFYYINYGAPDYSRLPPYIPRGSYKAELNFYDGSIFLVELHFYGSVTDKPTKWAK